MIAGLSLYDNTLGFYISASGKYSASDSIIKVLKLPSIYSFILAIFISKFEIRMPDSIMLFSKNISVMYSILGMMVIGLSVSNIKKIEIDFKLLGMCLLARFVVWPLATYCIILLDRHFFHLYPEKYHQLWMVVSFIPLGVNSLVVATILNNKPEKITTVLIITTVSALIYIPMAIKFFGL
jgi:predicted permease